MLTCKCSVCGATMVWPHDGYVELVHVTDDSHSFVRAAAPAAVPEIEHEQGKLPPAPAPAPRLSSEQLIRIDTARRSLEWQIQEAFIQFDAVVQFISSELSAVSILSDKSGTLSDEGE